jgi:hypothetical protein
MRKNNFIPRITDLTRLIKSCPICQKFKLDNAKNRTLAKKFIKPENVLDHLSVDILKMPKVGETTQITVVVDRMLRKVFTKK